MGTDEPVGLDPFEEGFFDWPYDQYARIRTLAPVHRSPFGPWVVNPLPIVKRPAEQKGFDDVGPIAPSVLIEDGKVRMWFHGFSKRKSIEIGYAQAPWPLKLPP